MSKMAAQVQPKMAVKMYNNEYHHGRCTEIDDLIDNIYILEV